jgi:hypothetical protein
MAENSILLANAANTAAMTLDFVHERILQGLAWLMQCQVSGWSGI